MTLTALQGTANADTTYVVPVYSDPIPPYMRELEKYDWDTELMYKIMLCESGGNPEAMNTVAPDFSVGLFQVNLYGKLAETRPSKEWLLVPENNISYAHTIFKEQGYGAWLNCWDKVK